MTFTNFSPKQLKALKWWTPESPHKDRDAIICDGAVRAGKSLCLSMSYVLWAMNAFTGRNFAICGKTVSSCRRNVILPLLPILSNDFGYKVTDKITQGVVEVDNGRNKNSFYVFGGKDEGSAALIQGVTLAGILFDEVALMPRSFVEQGLARCSVDGSKFWFNCNPEHPSHWFYAEWISKQKSKNVYYLHFTMRDNPSLSDKIISRYESLYSGVFYERYVLGKWVIAHGIVYPMFDRIKNTFTDEDKPQSGEYYISIDYGTVNPCSMGLWCVSGLVSYRIDEYYYDSRKKGKQLTDEEYYKALENLAERNGLTPYDIRWVVVDPSAASFITCIKRHGKFSVRHANNDVKDGIRFVSTYLKQGRLMFHKDKCRDSIREFSMYSWDDKKNDEVLKENDHAMDEIRYHCMTAFRRLLPDRGFDTDKRR